MLFLRRLWRKELLLSWELCALQRSCSLMQLHVGQESVMTWNIFQRMLSPEISVKSLTTWVHCAVVLMVIVSCEWEYDVSACRFCFTDLGFKHLLMLIVWMSLLKLLLLCLGCFLFTSGYGRFFSECLLLICPLNKRYWPKALKSTWGEKGRYTEPAFEIWRIA